MSDLDSIREAHRLAAEAVAMLKSANELAEGSINGGVLSDLRCDVGDLADDVRHAESAAEEKLRLQAAAKEEP